MPDFVCLISATDSEGCIQMFSAPDGSAFPVAGDLVYHEGEFFPVTESFTLAYDSPVYRAIEALCTIYPAERIYHKTWEREAPHDL